MRRAEGSARGRQGPRGVHPPHNSWKRSEPEAAALLELARARVGELADELGLEAGLLLKPASLRLWVWRAATTRPSDDGELLDSVLRGDDARQWQLDLTSGPLLEAVREFRAAG